MSWGERSCRYFGDCKVENVTMDTCNVDCQQYKSNGRRPDSMPLIEAEKEMEAIRKKLEEKND